MKQPLAFRLATLAISIVITSVLFESVADLGRPAGGEVQIAVVTQAQASPPLR